MEQVSVTCPHCGAKTAVEMKDNVCLPVFTCASCGQKVWTKTECCVICEFSNEKCPVTTKKAITPEEEA